MSLSEQSVDVIMKQITYLPMRDVVSLCQTNKRLYDICTNPNYRSRWVVLIENTYGNLPNYDELVRNKKFDYRLYTQIIKKLPTAVQLEIYDKQNDNNSFNRVLKDETGNQLKNLENVYKLVEAIEREGGNTIIHPSGMRVNIRQLEMFKKYIKNNINKLYYFLPLERRKEIKTKIDDIYEYINWLFGEYPWEKELCKMNDKLQSYRRGYTKR